MSGMWKRSHGRTSEAPPDERGGYRYVRPTATASHLDSTLLSHHAWPPRARTVAPLPVIWLRLPWIGDLGRWSVSVGGALECGDVDALHLHHRVEGPPCSGAIGITDQPNKLARND